MTTLTPIVSKLREWAKVYGGMDCSALLRDAAKEIEMQQAAIAKLLESHDRRDEQERIKMDQVSPLARELAAQSKSDLSHRASQEIYRLRNYLRRIWQKAVHSRCKDEASILHGDLGEIEGLAQEGLEELK